MRKFKKSHWAFIACIILTAFFMSASLVNNNNVAEVEQMQGYYIFVDSKPISDYEYLGTVKSAITFSGQYQPVRDALLKKARKQFPNGDGIIFHFHNGGTDRADVIRFKK